jgi:hypothetical protein
MRKLITTLSILSLFPSLVFAHDEFALPVDSAEKLVLKVTENGFEPKSITLHQEDASVFVVNSSKASLLTLSIDFKGKKSHCASSNLAMSKDGILKSTEPVGTKDFAVFCLPEIGDYEVIAYGLTDQPIKALVHMEPK